MLLGRKAFWTVYLYSKFELFHDCARGVMCKLRHIRIKIKMVAECRMAHHVTTDKKIIAIQLSHCPALTICIMVHSFKLDSSPRTYQPRRYVAKLLHNTTINTWSPRYETGGG